MSQPYYRLGLTGYPLGHSLSPAIQQAALQALSLSGEYRLYPVEDPATLPLLLDALSGGELDGLNVTIPYKQTAAALLDELEPEAALAGAVNVIYRREGRLVGANTDIAGFRAGLRACPGWKAYTGERLALVLGAGGSARAVCTALKLEGWEIVLACRRREQGEALAVDLKLEGYRITGLDNAGLQAVPLEKVTLLVNTTPLGMAPRMESCPWPEQISLPSNAWIYDLVYNPAETALLQRARAEGLAPMGGGAMLVEQAALAFERWTGRGAPRKVMQEALRGSLSRNNEGHGERWNQEQIGFEERRLVHEATKNKENSC